MGGSFGYYYMPEQRNSEVSTVTSDWQKDGHVCKPLQKTIIEGLSTDWSYDECVASVSRPNTENVVTVEKSDNSSQFDYRFATQGDSSGSLSFWDTWNGNAVISDDWQKEGFVCKPLQRATIHGLSTDWNYDECITEILVANSSTVTAVQKHHAEHFDYTFVSGGTISFYDVAYESSVLQKTSQGTSDWEREGYSCYPEPPYANVLDVSYNSSECRENIQPPSEDNIAFEKGIFWAYDGDEELGHQQYTFNGFKYFPFGDGITCYKGGLDAGGLNLAIYRLGLLDPLGTGDQSCMGKGPFLPSGVAIRERENTGDSCLFTAGACEANLMKDEALTAWNTIFNDLTDEWGGFGAELICNQLKYNANGFRCFDKPRAPATKELAIERYAMEFPPETTCAPLKQNSPFRCLPTDTPPATKGQAIERYTSEYPPETICEPLKQNSPFQCTRVVQVPMATILSLSVASAQGAFATVGLVFVYVLRKLEKLGTK